MNWTVLVAPVVVMVVASFEASGTPWRWACVSESSPDAPRVTYLIDIEGRSIDGRPASLEAASLIASYQAFESDTVTTSFNVDTGVISVASSSRGEINRARCCAYIDQECSLSPLPQASRTESAVATINPPAPTSAQPTANAIDPRKAESKQTWSSLLAQARAGKMTYLKASRLYKEKFDALFPEQSGNLLMNEYLAYMSVIGERVDRKKLTEAEAEYELAKKAGELQERARASQALAMAQQEAAVRKAQEEAAMRKSQEAAAAGKASEAAAARRAAEDAAARLSLEERRLALQREIAEKQIAAAEEQRRQESKAAALDMGLRLLFPPPPRMQRCSWIWVGGNQVQVCN